MYLGITITTIIITSYILERFQTTGIISSTIYATLLFLLVIIIVIGSIIAPLTKTWAAGSHYNVITAGCSIGSIIAIHGTNRADLMLGCDTEDVMYGNLVMMYFRVV